MPDQDRKNVTARQQTRNVMRTSTWVSLVGVGLFLASGFLIYKLTPSPAEKLQQEQAMLAESTIEIEIVVQDDNQQWQPPGHPITAGMQVGFRLSTNQPLHASLFKQVSGSTPQQLFDDIRIPPGASKIINFNNADYRYTTTERDGSATFCLLSAADSAALQLRLSRLAGAKRLDQQRDSVCISLPINP